MCDSCGQLEYTHVAARFMKKTLATYQPQKVIVNPLTLIIFPSLLLIAPKMQVNL